MRWGILGLLMVLVLLASANAADEPLDLQQYVDRYNANVDKAPKILKDLLGSERIDIIILQEDDSIYRAGLETKSGRIVNTVPGGYENPTIVVETTQAVIQKISGSDNKVKTFQEEREAGNITFTANTTWARLKMMGVLSSMPVLEYFEKVIFGP